jgi:hypothetical protein
VPTLISVRPLMSTVGMVRIPHDDRPQQCAQFASQNGRCGDRMNELTEGREEETETDRPARTRDGIVRKSMSPEDVPDEVMRNLLTAMNTLRLRAIALSARTMEKGRDAAGT